MQSLRYYGISPFEIEIIYDVLKESFELQEEQLAPIDKNIVSMVEIELPVSYDDSFFSSVFCGEMVQNQRSTERDDQEKR